MEPSVKVVLSHLGLTEDQVQPVRTLAFQRDEASNGRHCYGQDWLKEVRFPKPLVLNLMRAKHEHSVLTLRGIEINIRKHRAIHRKVIAGHFTTEFGLVLVTGRLHDDQPGAEYQLSFFTGGPGVDQAYIDSEVELYFESQQEMCWEAAVS